VDFERVARLVVIALSGVLGLVLFALPDQVASALGLAATDEFAYRSGGAAFLGYAVAFAAGWQVSPRALSIIWPATLGSGLGTALAAAITLVAGRARVWSCL